MENTENFQGTLPSLLYTPVKVLSSEKYEGAQAQG